MTEPTFRPYARTRDMAGKAHDDPMTVERLHRLMDGDKIVKHKYITPAKADINNAILEGTSFRWERA